MAMTADARRIFEDARLMSDAARTLLAAGDIRDAAEKAWRSIKRAADALIAARTGTEPRTAGQTVRGLRALAARDSSLRSTVVTYIENQRVLHGDCFYRGNCGPPANVSAMIEDAGRFVFQVEQFAGE